MLYVVQQMMQSLAVHTDPVSDTVEWLHLMVLGAPANNVDNPTWAEAMNSPNVQDFCNAMDKEITTVKQDKDTWDVVKREAWMNGLPSTWVLKLNDYQTGLFRS
jgi:hypothetical protein